MTEVFGCRRRASHQAPFWLALFLTLPGCAAISADRDLSNGLGPEAGISEHRILVATTRKRSAEPGAFFGIERATDVDYATVTVSAPPTHKAGEIETSDSPIADPRTNFSLREGDYLSGDEAFLAQLNAELRRQKPGRRNVLLFVHGFNTLFHEAAFRAAQIGHDAKLPVVPVVFSWASKGSVIDYGYDNNSALTARRSLAHVLTLLQRSDADKINIVAHSLGNLVLVEALIQLKLQGAKLDKKKVGFVLLASPDIDYDVFRSELAQAGRQEAPYYLLLSKDDQALSVSSLIAGGRSRLGAFDNPQELAALGATVIDATAIEAQDPAHHDKYAQIAQIAPQFVETFGNALPSNSARQGNVFTPRALGGAMLQIYTGR